MPGLDFVLVLVGLREVNQVLQWWTWQRVSKLESQSFSLPVESHPLLPVLLVLNLFSDVLDHLGQLSGPCEIFRLPDKLEIHVRVLHFNARHELGSVLLFPLALTYRHSCHKRELTLYHARYRFQER